MAKADQFIHQFIRQLKLTAKDSLAAQLDIPIQNI
jgi:hypothetical protein